MMARYHDDKSHCNKSFWTNISYQIDMQNEIVSAIPNLITAHNKLCNFSFEKF